VRIEASEPPRARFPRLSQRAGGLPSILPPVSMAGRLNSVGKCLREPSRVGLRHGNTEPRA
jgi:hypothetical protein